MTDTQKILKNIIDSEMACLWSAIAENLPKSQEMAALGKEKIFRAVKAGYLSYRPIFINQAVAEERARVMEILPKIITPTVEPPPNNLSQNQIFAGGQMNMLLRVYDLLSSLDKPVTDKNI